MNSSGMDIKGRPLFDVVHQAFPLPTTSSSPTLQGALKDGFEDAWLMTRQNHFSEFPSFDSCQKRFLGTDVEFVV